jgi:cholesterol transport system auxiliary component
MKRAFLVVARALVAALVAGLVAACGAMGTREADRYFVLDVPPAAAAPRTAPALVVMPTTVSSFYDTQDIAYSRAPGTRAYYQFNHWTDRPQRAVHAQLVSRLGAANSAGGFILATHLDEIYHDAAQQPGTARLTVSAQLVDPKSRAVVAQRVFNGAAPAASFDAPGAVDGMRRALGALLDEIAAWAAATPPAAAR